MTGRSLRRNLSVVARLMDFWPENEKFRLPFIHKGKERKRGTSARSSGLRKNTMQTELKQGDKASSPTEKWGVCGSYPTHF